MIAKLLNKLKYFSLTLIEIRVGANDYANNHGAAICILDFYVEVSRNRRGETGISWGHRWFTGNMWYKPLKKAG